MSKPLAPPPVVIPQVIPPANHQGVNFPTSTAQSDAQLTTTNTIESDPSEPTLFNKEASKSPLDASVVMPTTAGSVLEHSAPEIHGQLSNATNTAAKSTYITLSISEITEAALAGDAVAQYELGRRFYQGVDVPVNYEEALKWYTQSAEQGYFKSQHNLASMYYEGKGVEQDRSKAADWYQKAANQRSSLSQFNLAVLYENGDGVVKDVAVAFSWYLKAANQGHAEAQYEVGMKYLFGRGVPPDFTTAYHWISKAADQDIPDALYQIGRAYYNGSGAIEKDRAKSIYLYAKAAYQGHAEAQYELGIANLYGFAGVNKDPSKAVDMFLKAANQGHAEAQCQLGWIYKHGTDQYIDISKDYDKAVYWLRLSADQGDLGGQSTLADMYKNGHGVERSDENAVFWYAKAAYQGDKHSQNELSLAYKDGKGIKKDLNLSVYWQMKHCLNDEGDCIEGAHLDISYSAGLTAFIAQNLNEISEFKNVTKLYFPKSKFTNDEFAGFAELIRINSSFKKLAISTFRGIDERNFLMLVQALESNTQLIELTVEHYNFGLLTNENLTDLLARNVAIAELRKYAEDYPLIRTASFPLDALNIIIDKTIISYMVSGKSKEETKNAIDVLLLSASVFELEAELKN